LNISLFGPLTGTVSLAALAGMMSPDALAQSHPRFSPDGRQVAHFRFDLDAGTADILISDLVSGEAEPVQTGHAWSVNPAWTPDGETLVFASGPAGISDVWDIYEINLGDGVVTAITDTPEREMHTQVSPDGRHLSFVRMTDGPNVWIMDRVSGAEHMIAAGPARDFHPKWDADGQNLVFDRTVDDALSVVWSASVDGGEGRQVAAGEAGQRLAGPNYSDDGAVYAIASREGTFSLLAFEEGREPQTVLTAQADERFGAFDIHPDGQSAVMSVTGADGQIRLFQVDLATGARTLVFE